MPSGIGLDPWRDEPEYRAAKDTFTERGTFILRKLREHNAEKLGDVLSDLYRYDLPDPLEIIKVKWQVILAYMGASEAGGWRSAIVLLTTYAKWIKAAKKSPGGARSGPRSRVTLRRV